MNTIAAFFIISGIAVSILILYRIVKSNPQKMKIMNIVWPLTALWSSWLGLWFFNRYEKQKTQNNHTTMDMSMNKEMDMSKMPEMKMPEMKISRPMWMKITVSTLHCGAGCTLADLIGEWFTFFIPFYIGGSFIAGQWILDYILALFIGVYFQYAAIQQMNPISTGKAILKAFKIDFFSLTAWQLGMCGWMAIVIWGFNQGSLPEKNTWSFWFMMQIAMCCGFLTAYPVNRLLIKFGIKHAM